MESKWRGLGLLLDEVELDDLDGCERVKETARMPIRLPFLKACEGIRKDPIVSVRWKC